MDENDLEGTVVLEKLAEVGKVDAFFDAIDSDDPSRAESLMKAAGIDTETIRWVLRKLRDPDGMH